MRIDYEQQRVHEGLVGKKPGIDDRVDYPERKSAQKGIQYNPAFFGEHIIPIPKMIRS
jgi:hypothetical protein